MEYIPYLIFLTLSAIAFWGFTQVCPEGYEDENGFHYGKEPFNKIPEPPIDTEKLRREDILGKLTETGKIYEDENNIMLVRGDSSITISKSDLLFDSEIYPVEKI